MRIKAISAESRDLKTLEAINEEAMNQSALLQFGTIKIWFISHISPSEKICAQKESVAVRS